MSKMITLNDDQLDALRELINIGVGRAASMMNDMLQRHVTLSVPYIDVCTPVQLEQELSGLMSETLGAVRLGFSGSFSGVASIVFPPESAAKLVSALIDDPYESDLDTIKIGTLTEVGNIVINGVMGTISNMLNFQLNYSLPSYLEDRIHTLLKIRNISVDTPTLFARTDFIVQELEIQGVIYLVFESGSFSTLISNLQLLSE